MKYIIFSLFCILQLPGILSAAPSCNEFLTAGHESEEVAFVTGMNDAAIKNYLSMARQALQRNSYLGVLDYVGPVLVHDNKNIQALFLYARAHVGLGHIPKALKAQAKAMKLEGVYRASSYVTYAQLLIYSGRPLDAEKFLGVVLSKEPTNPSASGLMAQVYLQTGRLVEARDIIMDKIESEPDNIMNQILLYEYYYKSHFFADAYKVANTMVEQNKPKKNQVRVPRAYRKGLALRAKVVAKMNKNLEQAWSDIDLYDSYNNSLANWVGILRAEIQFKMGRADKSRLILIDLARVMKEVDPLVVAGLIYLENHGQNVSLANPIADPVINQIIKGLSGRELIDVTRLLKNFTWDYQDDGTGEIRSNMFNSVWIGDRYMQPRNSDTNNASRRLPSDFF